MVGPGAYTKKGFRLPSLFYFPKAYTHTLLESYCERALGGLDKICCQLTYHLIIPVAGASEGSNTSISKLK